MVGFTLLCQLFLLLFYYLEQLLLLILASCQSELIFISCNNIMYMCVLYVCVSSVSYPSAVVSSAFPAAVHSHI